MKTNGMKRRLWLGTLGFLLLTGFVACSKKSDSTTADAGGAVAAKRNVLTMQGAAR